MVRLSWTGVRGLQTIKEGTNSVLTYYLQDDVGGALAAEARNIKKQIEEILTVS
jgi:hypothetical protein